MPLTTKQISTPSRIRKNSLKGNDSRAIRANGPSMYLTWKSWEMPSLYRLPAYLALTLSSPSIRIICTHTLSVHGQPQTTRTSSNHTHIDMLYVYAHVPSMKLFKFTFFNILRETIFWRNCKESISLARPHCHSFGSRESRGTLGHTDLPRTPSREGGRHWQRCGWDAGPRPPVPSPRSLRVKTKGKHKSESGLGVSST